MATIEQALCALLASNQAVNAIVNGRIYPMIHPQGAVLPAVVYRRISGMRIGQHGPVSELARSRFQFDCIATSYAEAKTLASAVREALDHYTGTSLSVPVAVILVENEIDGYNFELDDKATTFTVLVDAIVWH